MGFFNRQMWERTLLLAVALLLLVNATTVLAQPTVSVKQFHTEFNSNQVRFQQSYKGKQFYITGQISQIRQGNLGDYVVALRVPNTWSVVNIVYPESKSTQSMLARFEVGQNITVLVIGRDTYNYVDAVLPREDEISPEDARAFLGGFIEGLLGVPSPASGRSASTPQPPPAQPKSTNSTGVCSFADIKKSLLITYSPDYENEEEDYFMSSQGNERKLYVDYQTKDSILTVEVYGEMGKSAYKFVFNKNLIEAEESSCYYDNGDFSSGMLKFGDKKTLKTSKDAERKLKEAFLSARESLYRKLRMPSGKSAMEYVKSGNEYLDRGDKNRNNSDYDLAIAEFNRAIQLDLNIATAYFGRGRGYLRKGDNNRAVADYSQALRLNPNDAISYSNRGRAYARMGDYDNAVADFESAYRIDPNNATIKQNLEKARRREKGL
jgi:tetratricopeptide (TPR) repeat protein